MKTNNKTSKKGSFIIPQIDKREKTIEMRMFLKMTPSQQEAMFKNESFLRYFIRDIILTILDMKSKTEFQKFLFNNAHIFYLISEHFEDFKERYWNPYVTTSEYTVDALKKVFYQI